MYRVRDLIPDPSELDVRLGSCFDDKAEKIISETQVLRESVVKHKTLSTVSGLVFIVLALALIFFFEQIPFLLVGLNVICLIILLIIALSTSKRYTEEEKIFSKKLNESLLPVINQFFAQNVIYLFGDVDNLETKNTLTNSKLITEKIDIIEYDDVFSIFEPRPITFRELEVSKIISSGKNSRKETLFHGVLVEVTLDKTLSGMTFISTEGDKKGFAHQDFMSKILGNGDLKETKLEWNQFEKDLHVVTDNGIEARYILSPDFMEDLHDWWSEDKSNIRMVFKENKMIVLLPEIDTKLSNETLSSKPEDVKEYTKSIIKPIWRILTLVDDLKL